MKLYIIDESTEAEMYIYGVDGSDCTERFFLRHFADKGIKYLTDEEKEKHKTAADYAVYNVCYEALADIIEKLQAAIDGIAEDMEQNGGDPVRDYTLSGRCYAI